MTVRYLTDVSGMPVRYLTVMSDMAAGYPPETYTTTPTRVQIANMAAGPGGRIIFVTGRPACVHT